MKLWKISQNENNGYDTYDSAVVAAETEDDARQTYPISDEACGGRRSTWASSPSKVRVEYLGNARKGMPAGVILASFNAG